MKYYESHGQCTIRKMKRPTRNQEKLELLCIGVLFLFLAISSFTNANAFASGPQTVVTSPLYTGYGVQGNYNGNLRVKGSWIVPAARCSSGENTVSNISVIIDGINGEGDIMQVGTFSDCVKGSAVYGAFAQLYPEIKEKLPTLMVAAGDVIEAQGKWSPSTHGWHAQIINMNTSVTQSLSATTSSNFTPKLDSGAFLLSNDGKTLTTLVPSSSGTIISSGNDYTGVTKSNVVGSDKGKTTIGQEGDSSGFTLVMYQMTGTQLNALSGDGGSFTISN
jgi:Peptidase A4 family